MSNKEKAQKKKKGIPSTRDLMGITDINEYSIMTKLGDLVFFIIKPTNISVLPDASVSTRIHALLNVLKGKVDMEMLALNSCESFESNKNYYQSRMENEELPVIRKLLESDSTHLDHIQVMMASGREFYMMIRLRNERESEIQMLLSGTEKTIKDSGFIVRRANGQDLKRMLGIYYEQNVTTEYFDDFDGERWAYLRKGTRL